MPDDPYVSLHPLVDALTEAFTVVDGALQLPTAVVMKWALQVGKVPAVDREVIAIDLIAMAVKLNRINPTQTQNVRIDLLVLAGSLGHALAAGDLARAGAADQGEEIERRRAAQRALGDGAAAAPPTLDGMAKPTPSGVGGKRR